MSFDSSKPVHGSGLDATKEVRLNILFLCEKLIIEAMPVLDKIPKSHRYRFGARLEQAFFQLPELVIQAASSKAKSKIYALNDHLDVLHSLLRIGAERKLISPRFLGGIIRLPIEGEKYGGLLRQICLVSAKWRESIRGE